MRKAGREAGKDDREVDRAVSVATALRRRLPLVLLVLATGLAGIGVAQAFQAQRSHRATAEALLHDYGTFAARSFLQAWNEILDNSLTATLAEARGAALRASTTQQCLNTLLVDEEPASDARSCGCAGAVPLVTTDGWAFHLTLGQRPSERLLGGRIPPGAVVDRALDSLIDFVRNQSPLPGEALRWVSGPDGDRRLFAFSALLATSGDTVVYGVEADRSRLSATLEAALDDERLLPAVLTDGQSNRELLAVRLVLPDGHEHWRSSPGMEPPLEGAQPIYEQMGGGFLRASVLPEAAGTLVIGGLPRNRVPLLLLVFGLSGVLAMMAILQLRKEEAFARQRQDFVAGVSHELRTPLAQIRLFVETLRLGRTRTDEERAWALGNIDRETLRLVRLVENILHFNRSERPGPATLERQPVVLGDAVRAVVRGFRPLLRPHEAEIRIDVAGRLVVEVDPDALHQVLLNLLDNAVKYGPRGQTIRLTGDAADDHVRIGVEDEGPGVPPRERGRIWDSFQRGRRATGSVATGSGIGLTVVREIVRAHGGRAWVEDRKGGPGARFVVEFPRLRTASPESLIGDTDASADGAAGSAGVA